MTKLFELILDNSDRITSYVLLLCIVVVLGAVLFGFMTGKIASPGDYKRLDKQCRDTTDALQAVTEELADSRELHAGATVRIEFLERDNQRLERDIAGVNTRCARMEAELDVLRRERDRWSSREPAP